ncbi:hypothetical protein ACFLT7_06070 [candidate division KSB1 bacterium]
MHVNFILDWPPDYRAGDEAEVTEELAGLLILCGIVRSLDGPPLNKAIKSVSGTKSL